MLANEAKFLGLNFMIVRWILTVIAIFVMAYITGVIVKNKDIPKEQSNTKTGAFEIKEEYCVGCGLCVKLLPEYYKMKNNKASVIRIPHDEQTVEAVIQSAQKCPTKAIIFEPMR